MPIKNEETNEIDAQVTKRFLQMRDEILSNKNLYKTKTLSEFCENVGMYRSNIYPLETGTTAVRLAHCVRLCRVYGISMNWLLLDAGPKMITDLKKREQKTISAKLREIARDLKEQGL